MVLRSRAPDVANMAELNPPKRARRDIRDEGSDFHLYSRVTVRTGVNTSVSPQPDAAPLAVLIGFLGSSPRIMESVAKRFEARLNYDTAWVCPPVDVTFSITGASQSAYAKKLLSAISSIGAGHGGTVLVAFSNSGGFLLRTICKIRDAGALSHEEEIVVSRVCGVIYDSCPVAIKGPWLGVRALLESAHTDKKSALARVRDTMSAVLLGTSVWSLNLLRTSGSLDGK